MDISLRVEAFRERIRTEPEFALELYVYSTVRVLMHKFLYYQHGKNIVDDHAFDAEETGWYVMHLAYGGAKDETSPCVGFDERHPFAEAAIEAGSYWIKSRKFLK